MGLIIGTSAVVGIVIVVVIIVVVAAIVAFQVIANVYDKGRRPGK